MSIIRFIPATDPRVRKSFKAIIRHHGKYFLDHKCFFNWWACCIHFPRGYVNTCNFNNWLNYTNFPRRYGVDVNITNTGIYMEGTGIPEPDAPFTPLMF